jgi:hypothetical protein
MVRGPASKRKRKTDEVSTLKDVAPYVINCSKFSTLKDVAPSLVINCSKSPFSVSNERSFGRNQCAKRRRRFAPDWKEEELNVSSVFTELCVSEQKLAK